MFVIFGIGDKSKKDMGAAIPVVCPNCNNPVDLHLVEVKNWFSLFFISVLPYKRNHYLVCEICSRGVKLTEAQADRAKQLVRLTRAFREQRVSEAKYNEIVRKSRLLGRVKKLVPPERRIEE